MDNYSRRIYDLFINYRLGATSVGTLPQLWTIRDLSLFPLFIKLGPIIFSSTSTSNGKVGCEDEQLYRCITPFLDSHIEYAVEM